MSCNSGQSTVQNGDRGFPLKCRCGLDVVMYTSTTKQNPGRPFFRCPTRRQDHLFKWVEDGIYEEVVDALPRLSTMSREIDNAKSDFTIEIEELKVRIGELEEDGTWSKTEIKKWKWMIKGCLVCLCVIAIAIMIPMFGKTKKHELVFGY